MSSPSAPSAASPDPFRLPDQDGNLVDSKDLLARGPLVVALFRGHW